MTDYETGVRDGRSLATKVRWSPTAIAALRRTARGLPDQAGDSYSTGLQDGIGQAQVDLLGQLVRTAQAFRWEAHRLLELVEGAVTCDAAALLGTEIVNMSAQLDICGDQGARSLADRVVARHRVLIDEAEARLGEQ
jgi:hypothetical protein